MPVTTHLYRPRNPKQTPYYRCVEDHLEILEQVYEDRFERIYGFFRPHVKQIMERYLDCGNLLNGFARIKCEDCGHEYLLAFVLKQSENPAKGRINAVTFAHPVIRRG